MIVRSNSTSHNPTVGSYPSRTPTSPRGSEDGSAVRFEDSGMANVYDQHVAKTREKTAHALR
eukprot:COSAG05_NODE_2954_length_2470_cov_1.617461_3_plen_62_part_00